MHKRVRDTKQTIELITGWFAISDLVIYYDDYQIPSFTPIDPSNF